MTKQKQLAAFIAAKIKTSRRTQREIARDAGIPNQNFLSMVCSGTAKVPMGRIPRLADALGISRLELLWMCLDAYEPALGEVIKTVLPDLPATEEEVALIRGYRVLREKGVLSGDGLELRDRRRKGARQGPWSRIGKGK